jgi:UDP-2,3-diacylglucosamine hydrolase
LFAFDSLDARTGFVSDVHLSLDKPALTQRFLQALSLGKDSFSQLVILGDLFDSWVGDDCLPLPLPSAVVAALKAMNMPIAICVGNRDFLLGSQFAQAIGARLLSDETVLPVQGLGLPQKVLLAHGDQWCSADVEYQQFRQNARAPAWQKAFLAQPLEQRLGLAARLRMESETAKKDKPADIMDVTTASILDAFKKHEVDTMIHGHTHRPASHLYSVNERSFSRHVLTDWDNERGEMMSLSALVSRPTSER